MKKILLFNLFHKIILSFSACLIFLSCGNQHLKSPTASVDQRGNSIERDSLLRKLEKQKKHMASWAFMKNGKKTYVMKNPLYQSGRVSYDAVLKEVENLTHKQFNDSTTFIIAYTFLDDLCDSNSSNRWGKPLINRRKKEKYFEEKFIVENSTPNTVFLHFFEEGIKLKNTFDDPEEYFFSDTSGFFRDHFFKHPSLCGSHMAIKPNGEVLIRNGEYNAPRMAVHLQPDFWEPFFEGAE